jgi:hypothetical protein
MKKKRTLKHFFADWKGKKNKTNELKRVELEQRLPIGSGGWRSLQEIPMTTFLNQKGTKVPRGFTLSRHGRPGNAFEVKDDPSLERTIESVFGYAQVDIDTEKWSMASSLIITSETAFAHGRPGDAYSFARRAAQLFPELSAVHAQEARMAHVSNRPAEGLAAARRALTITPGLV